MAIGVPIAELESKFSSPDLDGDVAPQPEHRETYADLERRFVTALHDKYPATALEF